jgi:two-component system LytT family sensor kinase
MNTGRQESTQWKKWGIIFLCYTGLGLFFFSQRYIVQLQYGRTSEWKITLAGWMVWSYCCFAVTPLILYMSGRFPLRQGGLKRSLGAHLCAAVANSFLLTGLYIAARNLILASLFPDRAPHFEPFPALAPKEIHQGLMIYSLVVGIDQAIHYYFRYLERELQASTLETQLAQAQLDALRSQLHPHFLFNTLNSISVLIHKDAEAAERMLQQLSQLLRFTLSGTSHHLIPLRQELEILERYLAIEQIRFQDRLTIEIRVDEIAFEALVPQFFFQPLVENAIRHGIANRATGGVIAISAECKNGELHLEVRDNGSGVKQGTGHLIEGVGLSNTRARLQYLYGAQSALSVRNLETGGLMVAAALPFQAEARFVA